MNEKVQELRSRLNSLDDLVSALYKSEASAPTNGQLISELENKRLKLLLELIELNYKSEKLSTVRGLILEELLDVSYTGGYD